jgi:hypothetical protein
VNKWFAECVPCQWQEAHDTQDPAIHAAETHVLDEHRDLFSLSGDVRSRKMADERIGHVQLRDENAVGVGVSTGAVVPTAAAAPEFVDEELQREESMLAAHTKWVADLRAKKEAEKKEQG